MSQPAEIFASDSASIVDALVRRGRAAMEAFAASDQARVDEAVTALAWSLYKPENAQTLATMAVEDTGLGNAADKVIKNQRKTFGTLRDLMRVKSVGIIEERPELGLVKYAKPVGVVGAVTPSTNPAATPVNKAMMAIKGRNAIIIAPSPAGLATTTHAVELMRAELGKVGAPADLVQVLPPPVGKEITNALMAACDLVVVTGSQSNVRAAYRSGTPAIGVGAGNVPVIIDSSAKLDEAAAKIAASKCFDNATSCSSENAAIILDDVYGDAVAALERAGGHLANAAEKDAIQSAHSGWRATLNRRVIAKDLPRSWRPNAVSAIRRTTRGSSWSRRAGSVPSIRSPMRSSPWCSLFIARRASTTPWARSARSWRSRAWATPSASIRRRWRTPDGSPRNSIPHACW